MVHNPRDRDIRIRRMKHDIYGSLNEIDRSVELTQQMFHDLRMDLVRLRIAEDEYQDEEEDL